MTDLLVPVSLDCLVVRPGDDPEDWALTALETPVPDEAGPQIQQLVPDPFQSRDPRPPGVHLHWALPDGLTHGHSSADPAEEGAGFPPVPDRWLVLRLSGDVPRTVTAWLLPDAGAQTPVRLDDALAGPALPAPGPAPAEPLTALGHGDLGWAGYYDNVLDRFALYDAAEGVTGPLAYAVVGWYTDSALDPVAVAGETAVHDALEALGWMLDPAAPPGTVPDRSVYHAAALAIGWPEPNWTGDGGVLGTELDLRPDVADIDAALGETLAEAVAALTAPGGTPDAIRLVEGLLTGRLDDAAGPSGTAELDAALHQSRFGSRPAAAGTEYIWRPTDPQAGLTAPPDTPTGAFVPVARAQPRVWHALDPALVVRGGGRAPKHGGDGRYDETGMLVCRVEGTTVTAFGVDGGDPGDGAAALPADPLGTLPAAYGVPATAAGLLVELAALDPGSAPDLASGTPTEPSPVAAARAAWWAAFDPALPLATALDGSVVLGTLPSPVGVTPPTRPWAPLHLEWAADYLPSPRGVHDWVLGEVDYELPEALTLPDADPDHPLQGRVLLSPAPATVLAGAAARGAVAGPEEAFAVQDLLAGDLSGIMALLRGDDQGAVVEGGPDGAEPSPVPRPPQFRAMRAGFLRLQRLRLVDGFGQYRELLSTVERVPVVYGSSLAVPGFPGVAALRPRFTAPARVLLRFSDASGEPADATTGVSPVCGYVVPSLLDGTLEFFDAQGTGLGRLRPDPTAVTAWEEDPGQPATFGAPPSAALTNPFLGTFADRLLAADVALAGGSLPRQPALATLLRAVDTTRWSTDVTGRGGDEHLSLLLGHPVAVVRAHLEIEVEDPREPPENRTTAVLATLGTLAHAGDGLLGYYVGDDFDRLYVVDPAVAELAPGLPGSGGAPVTAPGADPLSSPYLEATGRFTANPGVPVPLTLLMNPGSDVHVTVGLLPRKGVGLMREWTAPALSRLSPALRYGPALRDSTTTRLPLPTDVRGTWTWYRRPDPSSWTADDVVPATSDALLPDDPALVSDGWLQVLLLPDVPYSGFAITLFVTCVQSTGGFGSGRLILGIGGQNPDGSHFRLTVGEAILAIESGRFAFVVQPLDAAPAPIEVVRPRDGAPYLRTVPDLTTINNLDRLRECSHEG